jgi:hypothetical protein
MIPRSIRTTALFATFLLPASPVWACPLCESETGERVRAGIFAADFGYHLAVTLLPFPVFLGITALIHFGVPWGKVGPRRLTPPVAGGPQASQPCPTGGRS